jgi:hypothetical protein
MKYYSLMEKITLESFGLRNLSIINTAAENYDIIYKGIYYNHSESLKRIQNKKGIIIVNRATRLSVHYQLSINSVEEERKFRKSSLQWLE